MRSIHSGRCGFVSALLLCPPMLVCAQGINAPQVDAQQDLEQRLDLAAEEFNEDVASAYQQVAEAIDVELEAATKSGDLGATVALRKAKQDFQASAEPPSIALLKAAADRGRRDISRASSKLKAEYGKASREYVKTGDVDAAQRILEEQSEMLASVAAWLERQTRKPQVRGREAPVRTAQAGPVLDLQRALAGSVWMHHYKGGNFEFGFGRDGFIQLHKNWSGTRWAVTGPREVTFTGTTGATMKFTFNQDVDAFTNVDWDGKTPTTGSKTDRMLP
jgi:hypothetical protein